MAKKYGVGIVGCGWPGVEHAKAYKEFSDDCSLIAFCDVVEERVKTRTEEFGLECYFTDFYKLLADDRVDIVSICTPHHLHAPMAIEAAGADKHVLVEKPMALNVGEANRMIQAAEATGVTLSVIFGRRFAPENRFFKERVIPELGEIKFSYLVDFHYRSTTYYDSAGWRGTWKREGGGVFINQAIHTWDLYQWLHGGVVEAYGYWTNILHPTIEVEDIGYGIIQFSDGSFGKIFTTSCCGAPENGGELRIIGEKGELEVFSGNFALKDKSLEDELKEGLEKAKENTLYTGFPAQVQDLLHSIKEGREPFITGESAKQSLKIVDGIHWSGWNYQEDFKKWVFMNYDLPKTLEEGHKEGWKGGKLIQDLLEIVRSPDKRLRAPFLE
ncbi:MAG TPA: Gfo/Idh/MocA family oxidoreductase [Candidatus Latescibacteria bacterium]|nr:Gfo/Idh/MocA family oxidoreductase [Candidatus Latescibacterota bacterium]